MNGICEDCEEGYRLPDSTLCAKCLELNIHAKRLRDQRKPPKSVEVSEVRAIRPVVVWSLKRGMVWEPLDDNHSKYVAELWHRQDNPVMGKWVSYWRLRAEDVRFDHSRREDGRKV